MYITVQEVKDFLGETNTDHDTLFQSLINRVEAMVEADKLQKNIGSSTFTAYFDGDGSNKVLLEEYPIISVTSVHDDTDRVFGADTLIDSDDIVVYPDEGMLVYDGGTFTIGNSNIKVVYQAGHDPVPDDLKHALILYVAAEFLIAKTEINVIRPMGEGSGEVEDKPARLKKEADLIFKLYKKIR